MQKIKAIFITVWSAIFSWLGVLAYQLLMLVVGNDTDYITGIMA